MYGQTEKHPDSGLQVGLELPNVPTRLPEKAILEGKFAKLVPLDPPLHNVELYEATHKLDKEGTWAYIGDGPFEDLLSFRLALDKKSLSQDPLYFTLIDKKDNIAKGYIALMRIDIPNRVIEVGNVVYGASMRRTAMATEVQYLLMKYIFDDLGFRRYEWKCNALNMPSRRAAERYGFQYEGLFRQHMIVKGRNRDTAWYSITDSEWPLIKTSFEQWLGTENICSITGLQVNSLESFRQQSTI